MTPLWMVLVMGRAGNLFLLGARSEIYFAIAQ
jgi:hypothetical protein